ncbi:iron-sulfur cluster-binding protein [Thiorhodococcus mannitoliphagus]|uniref:Iron-sulfur cluster-binding protein n=1 Tax=Thiorhodococcus mannitoliphagus TaxID=329406 RepID=A0A6P1DSY1_9GAMM|nr:LutB/LldF family L-lactate oxidation iron-sulfur protein [Thiorhodococcus mannitoliphagus]NEX19132.1 iron-sulfur cluster-binding protein [Thiorhodococcus mannitoliphagus]
MTTELRVRAAQALGRDRVRANIRRAMDGLIDKRRAAFPDTEELERLRDQGKAIRDHALAKLPALLEQLEQNCTANGIRVHWAQDADAANGIILDIIRRHGGTAIIKGKSMVSEEIGLNRFLEEKGVEPIETDLGELIIQLAQEHPSHIVAPAVHKDRREIAELFNRHYPDEPYSEDIERLTAMARRVMRERFKATKIGLSGVNFAVAETGTLCLIENEGNGRLSTTAPDVHIAVTGIEKVVARLEHLAPLLTLLTRSATGQPITTYVNMISGPRKPEELDGPHEVHLVLLDNGRSRIHADPELRATLRCIRCAACMNHCPVYVRIGGHGYGTVYPGPIGAILEPQLQGLARQGELAQASTLCGACAAVCPVRIPIPQLLNRLRFEQAQAGRKDAGAGAWMERHLWRLWAWIYASPARYERFMGLVTSLGWLAKISVGPWARTRTAPRIAKRSLHDLAREEGLSND